MVDCIRLGDSGCVAGERDGFKAALRAAKSMWNQTGPESRATPCYRRLMDYGRILDALRTMSEALFAATDAGEAATLSDFADEAAQLQRNHRDATAQFLAACV